MQDCPEAKKPCKGILKTSSSFDRPGASYRKSAKFDELNVLQTYHPLDKDYGHMKIDEPKTPYNYINQDSADQGLDADLLAEKLRIAANTQTSFGDDDNFSDEEYSETSEERVRRLEFEKRRKAHYNEFEAVKIARKLIEEELLDDDDDDDDVREEEEEENGTAESEVVSVTSKEIESKTSDPNYETRPGEEQTVSREPNTEVVNVDSRSPHTSAANVRPMDVDHEIPSNTAAGRGQ